MVDMIYTDAYGREVGFVPYAEGDFTIGTSNTFQLMVPAKLGLTEGCRLMIPGTEYGGRIDGFDIETDEKYVTAVGRTWHGLLESNLVKPDAGQSHLVASGDCNEVMGRLVARLGLSGILAADPSPSGLSVSGWRFTRESEAMGGYSQIRAMLRSVGAKLRIRYSSSRRRAVLSAVARADWTGDGLDADARAFSVSTRRPVNHLHCMGEGEGAARVTLDLYADERGRVSRVQAIKGEAHREEPYDNPSADAAELEERGAERLRELQGEREKCGLKGADGGGYDIDDIVGGRSARHGVSVVTSVAEKIATVRGEAGIEYETRTEMEV